MTAPPDSKAIAARRSRTEGIVALLLVQVFFGVFPLAVKGAQPDFGPRAIVAWRIVFGATVLLGLALALHGRSALPGRRDLPRLFACSFLGIVVNQVLALEGFVRTSVVEAGLLMTLIPVFTYALAVLIRQEPLRGLRSAGIVVSLAGAVVLVVGAGASGGVSVGLSAGNLMIVTNCLSYAGFLVVARPLLARIPSLVLIAWAFELSLWSVPLLALRGGWSPAGADPRSLAWMAFILVFPTFLAYLLNTFALARVSASTTAVFIYLQPLVAGAAGVLVLDEPVSPAVILAALLLFAGIALVVVRPSARPVVTDGAAPGARSSGEPAA